MTDLTGRSELPRRISLRIREMPDAIALVEYGVKMEQLGFDSLWVWDHMLLGVEPNFPIIDSLTVLTAIAARTKRIKLGTGILVLPLRNAVGLAKQLSSMDQLSGRPLVMGMASGWYKREFDAMGIPFEKRGKIMDENLDDPAPVFGPKLGDRRVSDGQLQIPPKRDVSRSRSQKPHPAVLIGGYVDRVLKRAATVGDGWLTYFYHPGGLHQIVGQNSRFCEGRRQGSRQAAQCVTVADHDRVKSKDAVKADMMDWLGKEWDFPAQSDCTSDSAIMGTVDECVEQLRQHLAVGVQKIIFVPYSYEMDQIENHRP